MIIDREIAIKIAPNDEGGINVWSDDLPGLILSGGDDQKILRALGDAVISIRQYQMTKKDEIRAKAEEAIKDLLVVKCMENCQRSTAGSIITAIETAGLEIVKSAAVQVDLKPSAKIIVEDDGSYDPVPPGWKPPTETREG